MVSNRDLTNTTWIFKGDLEALDNTFFINYTSNGVNYQTLSFSALTYFRISYDQNNVYRSDRGWDTLEYKTITITGGDDVNNSVLIDYLESNATQQEPASYTNKIGDLPIIKKKFGNLPVVKEVINGVTIYEDSTPVWDETDLSGTTWVFDNDLSIESYDFLINFSSNNTTFKMLSPSKDFGQEPPVDFLYFTSASSNVSYDVVAYGDGVWDDNAYKTITITGGTDATNATLIAWLKENATLISYNPPAQLISFNINGTVYQAVDGMTWGEWVNSAYNTDNYAEYDDFIANEGGDAWVIYNYNRVHSHDLIVADCVCQLAYSG